MKIQPVASPHAVAPVNTSNNSDARAKAVAAFMGNQAPAPQAHQQPAQQVVQNQSQVSVEELGAIQPNSGQSDNTEAIQEDTQEAAPVEPKQPTAEEQAISRQFAQLARQEKQLRLKAQQQDQALKAREAALAAKEAELTGRPQIDQTKFLSRDMLKQDPLSALAEAGVTYEELTQQIMSQQPVDPRLQNTIKRLESRIEELTQANEKASKAQADQQTQAYQAAVKQISTDVSNLVKSDPNFETIKATNSVRDVVELIEQTYNQDGVLLSVEEAAQQVEDYLVEESMKLTRIEKIKRKLQEASTAQAASTKAQTSPKPQQPQQMKTLTNAASTSRQLSAKERAILAFKGELGKG